MYQIKIDNTPHNVAMTKCQRKIEFLDNYAERIVSTGELKRTLIGVFLNYGLAFEMLSGDVAAYSNFFESIIAAVPFHKITLPYNQTSITETVYFSDISDELFYIAPSGTRLWNNLSLEVIAKSHYKWPANGYIPPEGMSTSSSLFIMDGVRYNIAVTNYKRNVEFLDKGDTSRNTSNGDLKRNLIGTYLNYEMSFDEKYSENNPDEYTRLFEALSAAVPFHTVCFWYNQEFVTQTIYVTGVTDELFHITPSGRRIWGNLTAEFIAKMPHKTPSGG